MSELDDLKDFAQWAFGIEDLKDLYPYIGGKHNATYILLCDRWAKQHPDIPIQNAEIGSASALMSALYMHHLLRKSHD